MITRQATILLSILVSLGVALTSFADEGKPDQMEHRNMMGHADDGRISLGLSPPMKQRQLANMRSHLDAIQTIIGLIAEGNFDAASETAHSRLGLTEEMKRMCNMFDNDDFRELGIRFHQSADTLGETLKTKDVDKSLHALHETMTYCVQCHATFRQ